MTTKKPQHKTSFNEPNTDTARRNARPVLRVSHGSKTSDARAAAPRIGVPKPSSPPKAATGIPQPPRRKRPTSAKQSSTTVHTALLAAHAALEKKALNVEIIDLVGKTDYADYLVLMSASSDRHVHAIADEIQDELRKHNKRPLSVEGLAGGTWVLIDYGDVVVHVFQESARATYDIDGLWLDAARVPVDETDANP